MGRRKPVPPPPPEPPLPTHIFITGTERGEYLGGDRDIAQTIFGLGGDDTLHGRTKVDVLDGGDGRDFVNDGDIAAGRDGTGGRGANDTLRGGNGDDIFTSYFGADIIDGGAGIDFATVDVSYFTGAQTIRGALGSGTTLVLTNGTTLIDIERINLTLGSGDDVVELSGTNVIISTGLGNNRVTTGAGHDTIYGGAGNDVLNSGGGSDWILAADGNDRVDGGDGDDFIDGGDGNDVLIGGAGNDVINSAGGADIITGGAGADIFGLSALGGIARVLDFSFGEGDRVRATFIDGNVEDGGQAIADPRAAGLVTVFDTAEGALISVAGTSGSGLLLVGVTTAELPPAFLFG